MREIKFRFWLGHTKKMTYAHPLSEVGKIVPEFTEDIIPLQYTGLKDKNGTEIYEGDFVSSDYLDYGFVVWDAKAACWTIDFGGIDPDPFSDYHMNGFEILGNIYQHPHLLTPTK